jgi:hypothetical protein
MREMRNRGPCRDKVLPQLRSKTEVANPLLSYLSALIFFLRVDGRGAVM